MPTEPHSYRAMAGIRDDNRLSTGSAWVEDWLDRRWTRRGARNFILQCWDETHGKPRTWMDMYRANYFVAAWAKYLGFRIPSAAFDADRARVLRLAARAGVHLASDFPAVYRWCMKARR